jgi:hypothetical protein
MFNALLKQAFLIKLKTHYFQGFSHDMSLAMDLKLWYIFTVAIASDRN